MMYNIITFKNVFQYQKAKVNNAFDPGTANEHTVQWWFKKFCKGDDSPEAEHSDWPS